MLVPFWKDSQSYAFIKVGSASSLTTQRFEKSLDESEMFQKSTLKGRGIHIAFGAHDIQKQKKNFWMINYLNLSPGKAKLVDVTDFKEVVTLQTFDRKSLDKVHYLSLAFGRPLF